jgi:photosystem II stability/assembly factor-like uncharacterized protein
MWLRLVLAPALLVAVEPAAEAVHPPPPAVVADAVPALTASVFVTPGDGWGLSSAGDGADRRWLVLRTQDGGRTWQERHRSDRPLGVLDATAPGDVWVGGSGVVLHSADDGATWSTALLNRGYMDVVAVDAVDARTALVGGASGDYASAWSSHDGGVTFVEERVLPVSRPPGRPAGVALHGDTALVVTADDLVWRRAGQGAPWLAAAPCVPLCRPEEGATFGAVSAGAFAGAWSDGADHVVGVTDGGTVARTRDGGRTWTWRHLEADPGGDGRIGAVARSGSTMATADADAVAVSGDDGVSWRVVFVAGGPAVVTSVAVVAPGTVYVTVREPGAGTARAVTVTAG